MRMRVNNVTRCAECGEVYAEGYSGENGVCDSCLDLVERDHKEEEQEVGDAGDQD